MSTPLADVVADLEHKHRLRLDASTARAVAGGSINACYRLNGRDGPVFVKTNAPAVLGMFEAEAEGLEALRATRSLTVPAPLGTGSLPGAAAYLVLEWLDLEGRSAAVEPRLGELLAAMHRHGAETFGWHRDNTIGATPQPNPRSSNWLEFWRDARLGYQLGLADRRGLPRTLSRRLHALADTLERWLGEHRPSPSLVHGDLWSGNWSATAAARPCVFDPAVYWGDREVDVAMTRLFGGFGRRFYEAYEQAWPLPEGAAARVDLYNLYHLLNHFNLFGPGYVRAIDATLTRLEGRI